MLCARRSTLLITTILGGLGCDAEAIEQQAPAGGKTDSFERACIVRVSVGTSGTQGNGESFVPALSADGRYVAFVSSASNLVAGDTNGARDAFRHDLSSGTTARVSTSSAGIPADGDSYGTRLSADGQLVLFGSDATNLAAEDVNGAADGFVHTVASGSTEIATLTATGDLPDQSIGMTSVSADLTRIAFDSRATNFVSDDTNETDDVFVRDRSAGTTMRASESETGEGGNETSRDPRISREGRYVVFTSLASNLAPGDTLGQYDVFIKDIATGEIAFVAPGWGPGGVTDDGRYVSFATGRALVDTDTNGKIDIYVRDRLTGIDSQLSVSSSGAQGDGSSESAWMSADGRYVIFRSSSSNLVDDDANGVEDIFVHDRVSGQTERVNVACDGTQSNGWTAIAKISLDGRFIAFSSSATNLVAGDTNGKHDAFVGPNPLAP